MHMHVDARIGTMRQRQKLHAEAHVAGRIKIDGRNVANALAIHVIHGDARLERKRSQDGDFRCGVETVDVSGGIGLGIALGLRLCQGVFVAQTVLVHAREHVVGGAVDDTHDRCDSVGDERMLQRADDGNATANAGTIVNVDIVFFGKREDLVTGRCDKRLVGRDDALAVAQRVAHDVMSCAHAANKLDDQVDGRIGHDFVEVGGEQVLDAVSASGVGFARTDARKLDVHAVMALEVIAMVGKDVQAAAANGAGSHKSDPDRHGLSFRFQGAALSQGEAPLLRINRPGLQNRIDARLASRNAPKRSRALDVASHKVGVRLATRDNACLTVLHEHDGRSGLAVIR